MQRARLRDLGLSIGHLPPGPINAITDVAGILVGHQTIITDTPAVVRSGVTVIVPEDDQIWQRHLFAGNHVLNGNGEMTGLSFLDEIGLLCGPIAITGTHSIGAVHEGLVSQELAGDLPFDFCLPVVAETFDGWLSDPMALAVRPVHVHAALRAAAGNCGDTLLIPELPLARRSWPALPASSFPGCLITSPSASRAEAEKGY